jgi:hypothetical protein
MNPEDELNPNDSDTPEDTPAEPDPKPEEEPKEEPEEKPEFKLYLDDEDKEPEKPEAKDGDGTPEEPGPKEPEDQKDDSQIFMEIPTATGSRKVTAKDWKTLQAELSKRNETDAEQRKDRENFDKRNQEMLKVLEEHYPEAYAKLKGLMEYDPEVLGDIKDDKVRVELEIQRRAEAKEAESKEEAFKKAVEDQEKYIRDTLDEMAKNPPPGYTTEEELVAYLVKNRIADPRIGQRAMAADIVLEDFETKAKAREEAAVLKYQKDVQTNKDTVKVPGPLSGDRTEPKDETPSDLEGAKEKLAEKISSIFG